MTARCMIYGATGYTGTLVARLAAAQEISPILAGRNQGRMQSLAESLRCEWRTARLDDPAQLDAVLRGVHVVLNTAGPFSTTAAPLADACLRTGAQYLDVTGEILVFEELFRRDAEAKARQVMLMPGVGFAVVPSDCLAAHVARRLPGARHLRLGLSRLHLMSRGSAKTMIELVNNGGRIRREGQLLAIPPGQHVREFDYGQGKRACVAIAWADVFTAYYTTGTPNIDVYVEMNSWERAAITMGSCFGWFLSASPLQSLLKAQVDLLPEGPSETERAQHQQIIIAEAEDLTGKQVRSRLRTPETYTFTAMTALAILKRVLAGDVQTGFHTPAQVYGPDFILNFAQVKREDLPT